MEQNKANDFVNEYESKKDVYEAFALAVKTILEILLKAHGFKYQITARAKSSESLRKKLSAANFPVLPSVADVQDLSGCRILFYLETDIERFARDIYDEFQIIKRDDRYSSDDYNAVHFVVRLTESRRPLPEYAQFAGMICEIQLTTILYHAWSEMAHDIIYKPPPGLLEFDDRAYTALRKRFQSVMEEHIKKASHDFEFIHAEFQKIREGKKVFDPDFLALLERSNSNNEIHQNLKLLAQYVEEFGDNTPKELSIGSLIQKILEKSPTLKREPIRTVIGELKGYDFVDVTKVCLEILNTLKYQHPGEVFDILVQLSKASEPEISEESLTVLERLAQYNLHILRQAGYAVQSVILGKIERWPERELIKNFAAVVTICKELLKPSFEGTSWQDYKTMTLSSGALVVNDNLREIRASTIKILQKLFHLSTDPRTKRGILITLQEAIRTPHHGSNSEMDNQILDNSNTLIDFYVEQASDPKTDGHTLEFIEEQMRWIIRRFGRERMPKIPTLESLLDSNDEYQIFRVLVGYDGRLAPDFDFEKDRAEREKRVAEFVSGIEAENVPLWRTRILTILKTYEEEDPGKYQYFTSFVNKLSEQKPSLMVPFLKENEKELTSVLLPIISGIWKSSAKGQAKDIIRQWVNAGKHLAACARIFAIVHEIDQTSLEEIFRKAMEMSDVRALNCLADSIAENYPGYQEAPSAFVKVIRQLTKYHDSVWVNYVWYRKESIISALAEPDVDAIMENLLWLPNVDYHAEYILKPIAEKYPGKVIEWFRSRIGTELQERQTATAKTYDAIPFELHELRERLTKHEDVIIPRVLEWYRDGGEENRWKYRWDASQFLKIVFPSFSKVLEKYVISMIEQEGMKALDAVFHLLRNYQGESFLWSICKTIIKKVASDEKYPEIKSELFSLLSQTGVVSGEYGFAEAYEKKREDLKSWPHDGISAIKEFLREYSTYLEDMAIHARKKADEDIELRKRRFEE